MASLTCPPVACALTFSITESAGACSFSRSTLRLQVSSSSPVLRSVCSRVPVVVMASTPSGVTDLDELVVTSIKDAEEVCKGNETSAECVVAWDDVEELSAARAHKRDALKKTADPLEAFCKEFPETDECRVYED